MPALLAIPLCLILLLLAALHFYWAAAGSGGLEGVVPSDGGRPLLTPGKTACVVVGMALLAAALVAALRAGLVSLGLPAWMPRLGIWALAAIFAARAVGEFRYVGFFKRVRGTLFARRDTWLYSPLCVVLAGLAAGVALLSP